MPEFVIHHLSVSRGQLAITPMPGRTRHYHADWLRLMEWHPNMVLSMTTQAELERKGAGSLGTDLQNAGIIWHHFPVVDFGAPGADRVAEWNIIETAALSCLDDGQKVLVHCHGGCGRSGMAALRLMIAAGEDAQTALARLREVRPCAIETDAQMEWASL